MREKDKKWDLEEWKNRADAALTRLENLPIADKSQSHSLDKPLINEKLVHALERLDEIETLLEGQKLEGQQ